MLQIQPQKYIYIIFFFLTFKNSFQFLKRHSTNLFWDLHTLSLEHTSKASNSTGQEYSSRQRHAGDLPLVAVAGKGLSLCCVWCSQRPLNPGKGKWALPSVRAEIITFNHICLMCQLGLGWTSHFYLSIPSSSRGSQEPGRCH